uniref:Ribonuclease H-like domain-containing protein n=1 Tax=Tanacetum cinerariifolium TaxID=118510 RepID=A0A699HCX9_TANCI|nr:ribonuclease H-like domain-containing protein [Tanacetum cinerariifolium]
MSLLDDAAFMTLSPIKMIKYIQRQFIMSDPAIASVLSHLRHMLENNVPPSHEYEKTSGQGHWIIVDMSFMQIVLKIGCYDNLLSLSQMPTLTFMNKNHVLTKEIDMDHQLLFINGCNFTETRARFSMRPGTRGILSGSVLVSKGNVLVSQNVPTFDSSYRTDDESSGITSIRRSSRVSKLSKKLNDFVLDNKVKYDLNRPDIASSVHCLRQYTHSPLQSHFEAPLRVLRYLKSAHGAVLFK